MFCFQCEQTEHGTGCTTVGVCGKTPEVAIMQDNLIACIKDLSHWAMHAQRLGIDTSKGDKLVLPTLFSTLTNVNFDDDKIEGYAKQVLAARDEIKAAVKKAEPSVEDAVFGLPDNANQFGREQMLELGREHGVLARQAELGATVSGLQELIVYGMKGLAAYATHARELGKEDPEVYQFVYRAMDRLANNCKDVDELIGLVLATGECNTKVLGMLDNGHTSRYGHPTPTQVNMSPVEGKCILVSGHDLTDLEALLEQTKGTGINVYSHGEIMPAHGYPELKKNFPHFVGHYGGPWQLQKFDFARFPGPIVMTTNCLIEPRKTYANRLFTCNFTGWPGVTAVEGKDFSKVIESAKAEKGFTETKPPKYETVGFAHGVVGSVLPSVLDAAKGGDLERIFVIGGCDGSEGERNYYTDLAVNLPDTSMILTLGCGKFRVMGKKDYGTVRNTELPRYLDMGQCNDSYSAVVVASELAKALDCGLNDLPLTIVLSWFEQKAVAVLLSLLHLGVKDIHIGPVLPAFISPEVLAVLVEKFSLHPIDASRGAEDAKMFMTGKHSVA